MCLNRSHADSTGTVSCDFFVLRLYQNLPPPESLSASYDSHARWEYLVAGVPVVIYRPGAPPGTVLRVPEKKSRVSRWGHIW